MFTFELLSCILVLASTAKGWNINTPRDRHACQALSSDPLNGCDRSRTLFVGGNGTYSYHGMDKNPVYVTVQSGLFTSNSNHEFCLEKCKLIEE